MTLAIRLDHSDSRSLQFQLFDQIIVDVREHTMISHMGHTLIAVPFDDVMGIYEPWVYSGP